MEHVRELTISRTPTKKVWNKLEKVNGNYKSKIISPLERGKNTHASTDKIADIFGDHYANISRDPHKKSKPCKQRKRKKEEDIAYNKPFTNREQKITKEYST